ncbi:helix-turn-helix domain-containing protein [Halobacterium litoreum]|uniref:Helix-turn-helix domain-containing protein n=1 Tax=Halobacterium litoreum TaxID=2039234 RepID=A0ABD5NC64_9EURY|nr:helix-turn-helix domain-containing protein [Halobacterium litoreum]UHH14253.1 helix-turn-helix domain-containing protein [Halobacterium litoreum]
MTTRQVPTSVESPRGKLVYLSLTTRDSATVDELHADLDVPRITLFSVLRTLQNRGLVARDGERYLTSRPS